MIDVMEIREILKGAGLFAQLTDKELDGVLATAKPRTFNDGDKIIRDGHPGGAGFYLLLEGNAEVRKGDTVLARFGPRDYFGEMALLLEDTPRTADVVAIGGTKCLVLTKWDFQALLSTHPDMAAKIMTELAKRLRDTDRALSEEPGGGAPRR